MSENISHNQKHMNQDVRIQIEKGLDQGLRISEIAALIQKDPTTVSKEIRKHRVSQPHNPFNEPKNKCTLFSCCTRKNICQIFSPACKRGCRNCPQCNRHCPDFTPRSYHCALLDKAPYVCNACMKKTHCRMDKAYYRATLAQREYRTVLVESRAGINISEEGLRTLDETVSPLIRQGQSPYMILRSHPEIQLSEKTLYNYIDSGALTVRNADLPKKVRYKPRSAHGTEIDDRAIFEGRTYKDLQALLQKFPDTPVVEMDTVLGCEGSRKALLTLFFGGCSLMAAFLLDSKESAQVEKIFDRIEDAIGTLSFFQTFPAILTDRGGEFSHPDRLECGTGNTVRTCIFYCDPMASWQKPHCEKNHTYIRKICPKGTSFDGLAQQDITWMMSHINSAPRNSLGGLTPLRLASMMLSRELLDFLAFQEIPADEVILTPALFRGRDMKPRG